MKKNGEHFPEICTLPETNIVTENGWLEDDCFLLGWPIFRCELLVPRRADLSGEDKSQKEQKKAFLALNLGTKWKRWLLLEGASQLASGLVTPHL